MMDGSVQGSEYISTVDKRCRLAFEHLLDLTHTERSPSATQNVSVLEYSDMFDQYRVWSANVGASNIGDRYKKSLDYRMREAPFYKEKVLKVLYRLIEVLSSLTSLLQAGKSPWQGDRFEGEFSPQQDDASLDETFSDWAISDSSSDSNSDVAAQRNVRSTAERWSRAPAQNPDRKQQLTSLSQSLRFTITCLYRLPVRNMAPVTRLDSAKQGMFSESSLYQYFDVLFVRDLFSLCDRNVASRLGRLVTRRRHLMHYRHMHNLELQQETMQSTAAQALSTTKAMLPERNTGSLNDDLLLWDTAESSVVKTTIKASTFDPNLASRPLLDLLSPAAPSEAETSTSAATTRTGQEYLPIPPRPIDADGNELENFECPYCGLVVHVRLSNKSWKKHVLDDLEPYVCVSNDCSEHEVTYVNKDEWFQHQLRHFKQYHCGDEVHGLVGSKVEFQEHMLTTHKFSIPLDALAPSTSLFLKSARSNIPLACPLCKQITSQLKQHLARHLERIALFAIPKTYETDQELQLQSGDGNLSMRLSNRSRSGNTREEDLSSNSDAESGNDSTQNDPLDSETNDKSMDAITGTDQSQSEDRDELEPKDFRVPNTDEEVTWLHVKPQLGLPPSQLRIRLVTKSGQNDQPDTVMEQNLQTLFMDFAEVEYVQLQNDEKDESSTEATIFFHHHDGADKARAVLSNMSKDELAALPVSFVLINSQQSSKPIHEEDQLALGKLNDMPSPLTDSRLMTLTYDGRDDLETRERLNEISSYLEPEARDRFGLDHVGRRIIWIQTLKRRGAGRQILQLGGLEHRLVLLDNVLVALSRKESASRAPKVYFTIPIDLLQIHKIESTDLLGRLEICNLARENPYQYSTDTPGHVDAWIRAVRAAKGLHHAKLASSNAIPFSMSSLFEIEGLENDVQLVTPTLLIPGSPLSQCLETAIRRVLRLDSPDILINTAITLQHDHHQYLALGTTSGIHLVRLSSPAMRPKRILLQQNVTQIEWIQRHNLVIMLADGEFSWCSLNEFVSPEMKSTDSSLTTAKNWKQNFFRTAFMEDTHLVFLCRNSAIRSDITVLYLPPSYVTDSKNFLRSRRPRLREYDELYVSTSCYSINAFKTTLAMITTRGIETMLLSRKQPWSVPNLQSEDANVQPYLSSIASRIERVQALGMFRLSQAEFLLVYNECALYINQHADISRGVVMEFAGKAKSATLYRGHLFLFHDDWVEIRNAENGRLVQVVEGIDISMLDDGHDALAGSSNAQDWKNTVKFRMRHPEQTNVHLILEFTPFRREEDNVDTETRVSRPEEADRATADPVDTLAI